MKFKDRKYLRKKSLLVQEYLIFGLTGTLLYMMFSRYNKKINPKDKAEEEVKGETVYPVDYFLAVIKKYTILFKAITEVNKYESQKAVEGGKKEENKE